MGVWVPIIAALVGSLATAGLAYALARSKDRKDANAAAAANRRAAYTRAIAWLNEFWGAVASERSMDDPSVVEALNELKTVEAELALLGSSEVVGLFYQVVSPAMRSWEVPREDREELLDTMQEAESRLRRVMRAELGTDDS
jgi:hypothetical protein